MRTGNEPMTARSPLRLRLCLSLWGMAWALFGLTAFSLVDRPGWAVACGLLLLLTLVDLVVIVHHIHQGPHYQPGRNVPRTNRTTAGAAGTDTDTSVRFRRAYASVPAQVRATGRDGQAPASKRAARRYSGFGSRAAASRKWRTAASERPER